MTRTKSKPVFFCLQVGLSTHKAILFLALSSNDKLSLQTCHPSNKMFCCLDTISGALHCRLVDFLRRRMKNDLRSRKDCLHLHEGSASTHSLKQLQLL